MSLSNNLLLINESVHNAAGKIPRSGDGSSGAYDTSDTIDARGKREW